jgi:hypothetical protein
MSSLLKAIKAAPSKKDLVAMEVAVKVAKAPVAVKVAKAPVAKAPVAKAPVAVKVAKAPVAKAPVPVAPPNTPLVKAILKAGFTFSKTQAMDDQRSTAYGFTRPDGAAALIVEANIDSSATWVLKLADGTTLEGASGKEFVEQLSKTLQAEPHVLSAVQMLGKVTSGSYRVVDLAGDSNYAVRVRLLKVLRKTDKVLVKDSGVNKLVEEFYAALKVEKASAASMAGAFAEACAQAEKRAVKGKRAADKVEKEEIAATMKRTAFTRVVNDGKPILDAPVKLTKAAERKARVEANAALAARVRRAEANMQIALPKPDADITVNLAEIGLLEDPNNGIVLLMLEKPNSQGAICVYNNGSRVAHGVVPTDVLRKLRPLASADLVRDVNQLLHPITAGVIVTPVAERHLTAVLAHCKENITMGTAAIAIEKTKKFAAPTAVKKSTAKAEKTATPAKVKVATKKSTDAAPTRAGKFTDAAIITVVAKENPYREGTKAYATFTLFAKAKNVEAFKKVAADKTKYEAGYLNYASRDGYIKVK